MSSGPGEKSKKRRNGAGPRERIGGIWRLGVNSRPRQVRQLGLSSRKKNEIVEVRKIREKIMSLFVFLSRFVRVRRAPSLVESVLPLL